MRCTAITFIAFAMAVLSPVGTVRSATESTTNGATVSLSTETAAQVALAWEPSPDSNVTGYFLYYGTDNTGLTNRVDVGNTSSITLKGMAYGAVYQFAVKAYDGSGLESDPSNQIQYVTPRPQAIALQNLASQNQGLQVQFQGTAGGVYRIESSEDLVNWITILTTNCPSDGTLSVPLLQDGAYQARFFRMAQDR